MPIGRLTVLRPPFAEHQRRKGGRALEETPEQQTPIIEIAATFNRRPRFIGSPLRRSDEDRGVFRRGEPAGGVAGVSVVVPGAAAAEGGDGAAAVGEAVQARPSRR